MYRRNVCNVRMLKPELDTFLPFMYSVLHLTTTAKHTHIHFPTSHHSIQKRSIRTNNTLYFHQARLTQKMMTNEKAKENQNDPQW